MTHGQAARGSYIGLDLGLRRDPSAVVVVERLTRWTGEYCRVQMCNVMETVCVVRQARRFPLETPYVQIPEEIRRVVRGLPDQYSKTLTVDATGVGAPVVELLRRAELKARLVPVVITGGEAVGHLKHATTVPRRALLENLRMLMETGMLKVPGELENRGELRRELLGLGRPGGRERDDMAFALALACWELRPAGTFGWAPERLI